MKRRDPSPPQLRDKSRQELIAYALQTEERLLQVQEQLAQREQQLSDQERELADRKKELADREQQLQQKQEELAIALAQIDELKRQLFGAKADKLSPEQEEQLAQVMADLEEQAQREPPASQDVLLDEDQPPPDGSEKKRPRRRRHPTPAHLEVQEVILEPEGLCDCPNCRQRPAWMKDLITEEFDFVPAKFILRRYVRRQYGSCQCGHLNIQVAPLPSRLLPQSKLGVGLAVHILLTRFDDHVAYYSLERIFSERHGMRIPRQQMVQWVELIAESLQFLCERMFEGMLAQGYLQVDETPVKVLDPEIKGKAGRGYLWFYSVPGGEVFLDFQTTRGQTPVRERLKEFSGIIQTDAYEVYDAVARKNPQVKRIGCAAHSRRRFHVAARQGLTQAIWFIGQFRRLYKIEDEAREAQLEIQERHALRREKDALSIWASMKARAEELHPGLLPKSSMGKAVNYFLNEYQVLIAYLEDGRLEIDNNLVENNVRPTCVGKKRWLFIGHPNAGWRSAVIYTLLITCRRLQINPQEYLTSVLKNLGSITNRNVDDWLPARWKKRQAHDDTS
jgi:transposase